MKIFSLIIFFTLITFLLSNFFDLKFNKELYENDTSSERLKRCFDLENFGNRKINDSIKLIEYCLVNYGSN